MDQTDLNPVEQWRQGYNSALQNLLRDLDGGDLELTPEGVNRWVAEVMR